jgi:hypothetical protein
MQQLYFIDKSIHNIFRAPFCHLQECKAVHHCINFQDWTHAPTDKTMTILKLINNTSLLTPYEQFFISFPDSEGKHISKQNPGEPNAIFQLAIDYYQPPARTNYSKNSLYTAHTACLPASQDSCQHFKLSSVFFHKNPSLTVTHNHIISPKNTRPDTTYIHSDLTLKHTLPITSNHGTQIF